MARLYPSLLLSVVIASSASAVTMDWTLIGNPGNACDPQTNGVGGNGCFGAVDYYYSVGVYEVTNAQYADFLNAKAKSDPLGLYDGNMKFDPAAGGISRSGFSGSYVYTLTAGRENWPVSYVTTYDAMRFANWMNNGQGDGDTETGAYTLIGGTETPSNGSTVERNPGASVALPTENEWYKAAYYDGTAATYFDYPTGTNVTTECTTPTATPNTANCPYTGSAFTPHPVGSYPGSPSPYGTYDQGGNVSEGSESFRSHVGEPGYVAGRVMRGGSYSNGFYLQARARDGGFETPTSANGFRLVMLPEPSTSLLVLAGVLSLGIRRRVRA